MYKTPSGKEIDIEAAIVYVNRSDLVIKSLESIPKEITVHFVQETDITKNPDLRGEIFKRSNVQFYEKGQQGCATDWNFCTKQCKSKYLLLVSADCRFLGEVLNKSLDIALDNPDIKVFSYWKKWMKIWLYDVDFFKKMGGFDERYWIGGEDEDFQWRMMKEGYQFGLFRTKQIDHMDGGKHTRDIKRPESHCKSVQIQWEKWGWTSKRQRDEELSKIENYKHFRV